MSYSSRLGGFLIKKLLFFLPKDIIRVISLLFPRNERVWLFWAGAGDRFAENSKYLFLHAENESAIRNVFVATDEDVVEMLEDNGYEAYMADSLRGKLLHLRAGVVFETHGPLGEYPDEYTVGAQKIHLSHGNYVKTMGGGPATEPEGLGDLLEISKRKISDVLGRPENYYTVTSLGLPAEIFAKAYGASETNLIPTGFPRNDALFDTVPGERIGIDQQAFEEVIETHKEQTTVFYAPTHRRAFNATAGTKLSDIEFDLDGIAEVLDSYDACLYIATHPEAEDNIDVCGYDRIKRLRTGGDIYPFLRYCDVLVTDYSGIFYDYLLLDRPIAFYAPDLDSYRDERGFYVEYESHVPGPIAKTQPELITVLDQILEGTDEYAPDREVLRNEFYQYKDSKSAQRVVQTVKSILD